MLESELAAAVAGGVTSLVCPPDTDPVLDEPGLVEMLKFRARKLSRCRAVPARRADARPGRRGADRDGRAHRGRLRRLLAGRRRDARHPGAAARAAVRGDLRLHGLAAAAGRLARRAASRPAARWPPAWACRACRWRPRRSRCTRIFELVRATGARVHLCRLCSAAGVELVRAAKAEGLPVTCDVSINSLHLTDVDIGYFNAACALDAAAAPAARPRRAARRAGRRHDRRAGVATTRRSTTTRRTCRSPRPSPAPPGSSCCSAWR